MIITCPHCGKTWEFDEDDIIFIVPYPHYDCPDCGEWLPAF